MNNNKVNIGVAIAIGLISCITNIFSKELHDWLSSFSSVNLAWVIPIFNLLLITGFVWWLLRVFTFRKLQEYQSSSTISPELNELKSTITKLGERVSNEVNFQQRNLIEVEDSKQRKFCMDESKRMNDKIQEQGSTISELRNQLTQHKTWLEELKENSYTAKDRFEMELTKEVLDPNFTTTTKAGAQKFLENLIGYYIIMEGIFFYSGFVMILSFHRQNRMTGIGEQFQYILRDETIHLNFGIDLINGIKEENPHLWSPGFQAKILEKIEAAVELEIKYAQDCLPRGILGLTAPMFREYVQYIADRRLERIGLKARYRSKNPFPWMSETIDLGKEKNFFETRITEYQSASTLTW